LTNESAEYLAKRDELRMAEIESIKMRERVAQLRRELPLGAPVQDYEFVEGPADLGAGDAPTRTVRRWSRKRSNSHPEIVAVRR